MECRILGPVEIAHNGHVLALGATRAARFLAALANDVGRPVPLETLIHRVWDDDPPRSPLSSLYSVRSHLLERTARLHGGDEAPPPDISTKGHAYTLRADPESVDRYRFEQLADHARALAAAGDDTAALKAFRHAETLWRGEPLTGLDGLWAEGVRAELGERRVTAAVDRATVTLRLGHFADVTAELPGLVARHPTDELLIGLLMTAHYGRGRGAEALRLYAELRARLRDQLGSSPRPELARLHEKMLANVPVETLLPSRLPTVRPAHAFPRTPQEQPAPVARAATAPAPTAPAAPNTLPLHSPLVGREREMSLLMSRLDRASASGGVVALQSISGMAGVGKSLMAWSAAERLADRFPDGAIHVDLRANTPGQESVSPRSALSHLLRTLGALPQGTSDDLDTLAGQWRAAMSGRRMVVVLDDASGPEQVRPLLPGASPSVVLITSRRRLSGLPGVRPVVLDVLPVPDAVALFRQMIDDDRANDANEVAQIVSLCGCLPLAVEIAASRLSSRPSWTLRYLIDRLSREHALLEELHDTDRDIAVVFRVSYDTLTAQERAVFRLLSLHPGPDFDQYGAAAVTGLPLNRVERAIDTLVDTHLLQAPAPGRYRFHDLLGEFAHSLQRAEDSSSDREAALLRLIRFSVVAADAADRLIHPERTRLNLPVDHAPGDGEPAWHDRSEAEQWVRAEHVGLIKAAHWARTHGHPEHAALLGHALGGFLEEGGFWEEAEQIHRHAAHHWRETGRRDAEIRARIDLGAIYNGSGRYEQAMTAFSTAATLAAETGDADAEHEALHGLGILHWNVGRLDDALSVQRKVLALREREGDRRGVARALNNLGITQLYLGRYRQAHIALSEALRELQAIDDKPLQFRVLNNIGDLYVREENFHAAREAVDKARSIELENASRAFLAVLDITHAATLDLPRELDEALTLLHGALELSRELSDVRNEVICLNEIGKAYLRSDKAREALEPHARALSLARGIGAVIDTVQAMNGLGAAESALRMPEAGGHLTAALALARQARLPVETAEAEYLLQQIN